jgi:selenocysteine lyase/cysteine desulfurase
VTVTALPPRPRSGAALTGPAFPGRRGYLDTATCGLPSTATLAALDAHLAAWRDGGADLAAWDVPVRRSRELAARLLGVGADRVSLGSQVSVTAATVARGLAPGTRVVLVEGDFTSLTWPFLARTDLRCRVVPLDAAADAASEADWLVASTVQSSDGRLLDVDHLPAVRTLLDATQSLGWLPIEAGHFDVVTTAAYKWLSCPRGTTVTAWSDRALAELPALAPGWYAGTDPVASLYAGTVALADDARAHDVSPAWPCWAGAAPALQLLVDTGVARVHAHDVRLAGLVRTALGLPPSGSAVVSLPAREGDAERLAAAGVRCSARAGRVRLGFHHYNDDDDVDRVVSALGQAAGSTSRVSGSAR